MSYEVMARTLEPALKDLLEACQLRERGIYDDSPLFEVTVSVGGDDATFFARASLWRPHASDAAKVYVFGWWQSTDLARYFGGNPPPSVHDELLRLRGPVRSDFYGFSKLIAQSLCERVDGADLREENGLPFFSLPM